MNHDFDNPMVHLSFLNKNEEGHRISLKMNVIFQNFVTQFSTPYGLGSLEVTEYRIMGFQQIMTW